MAIKSSIRDELAVIVLPPHDVVIPGANNQEPTDAEDIEYNAWCTARIKDALAGVAETNAVKNRWFDEHPNEVRPESLSRPMLLTQYPRDSDALGDDSRDVVSLDDDGEVVVLDSGVR